MAIKFTILGCGSSLGIPRIDGYFGKCNPKNKKNFRTRCSALISSTNIINLSPGTPAMTSTWMMMVGTGQLKATLLNAQINKKTGYDSLEVIDAGIYPFVREIKDKIDRDLGLVQKFSSAAMRRIYDELTILTRETRRPILLLGETGTGKTTLAIQLHQMSGFHQEQGAWAV